MKLKKDPLKFQKIQNRYKGSSNKKIIENRPPKSGHSDSKYNFEIFKSQKCVMDTLSRLRFQSSAFFLQTYKRYFQKVAQHMPRLPG